MPWSPRSPGTTRGWRTWPPPISPRSAPCSRRGRISWAACRSGGSWRSRWPSSCSHPARKSRCWPCSTRRLPGPPRRSRCSRRLAGHLGNLRRFGPGYVREKLGQRMGDLRLNLRRRLPAREESASQILADEDRLRHLLGETAARYDLRAYPGRITLFALAHRDGMSDSLFDPALVDIDPQLGWGRIAAGGVEVHELPGEHSQHLPGAARAVAGREADGLPGGEPGGPPRRDRGRRARPCRHRRRP